MTWDDYRLLLELRRRGSFLAAGAQLGVSASTVLRRVKQLEAEVGRPFVHATARGVWLEPEALELAALAEQFELALAARARDAGASPFAGVVRVSVPDGFAPTIAEAALRFRRAHPETLVEILTEQRFVDLAAREADIGVRGARSSSPVLVEKALGTIATGLFASRTYLAQRLPSKSLADADFSAHDFLVHESAESPQSASRWLVERGARRFPLRTSSFEARVHAARGGMGLVVVALGDAREQRGLVRVRLETPAPSLSFFLVMHQELRRAPRVRGLADEIERVAAEHPALQRGAGANR